MALGRILSAAGISESNQKIIRPSQERRALTKGPSALTSEGGGPGTLGGVGVGSAQLPKPPERLLCSQPSYPLRGKAPAKSYSSGSGGDGGVNGGLSSRILGRRVGVGPSHLLPTPLSRKMPMLCH